MSNHHVQFHGYGEHSQARCLCGSKSPIGSPGDCEVWAFGHTTEVGRIRAQLGTRNPTLRSQYAWFVLQAENEDNPAEDRVLWKQLADELAQFVVRRSTVSLQQEPLF